MNIRSMTGYAQVKAHVSDQLTITLSLKSVNHRFLDLHLRLPVELDPIEMKVRRVLKERLHRGHIEVTLTLERSGGAAFAVNRELVGGYLRTFREVAEAQFGEVARIALIDQLHGQVLFLHFVGPPLHIFGVV